MSLERLRPALLAADFKPHTLTVGASTRELAALMSPSSRRVFGKAWRHGDRFTYEELLSGESWPSAAVAAYKALPDDERIEVLALSGFYIHELVHKIDFLTTPFGVAFYGRACLETLGFQECTAQLIAWLGRSGDHAPLRDVRVQSDAVLVQEGMDALLARVRWFDALRGAPAKAVDDGWAGDRALMTLFGHELSWCCVHEIMPTVSLPDDPRQYLRPLTILENRAVAISILHLFWRLGADDYASSELARYMRVFYEPRFAYPDYRFLLDLFARAVGATDFTTLVETKGPAALRAVVQQIVILGWYALHAPPVMPADEETFANSSPVVRLIFALTSLEHGLHSETSYSTGVEFLESLDADELARKLRLSHCRDVLDYCVRYLEFMQGLNRSENAHPGLAAHFNYIFDVQLGQLRRRLTRGYESMLGMPDDGHLLGGFEELTLDGHLLLETYRAPCDVRQWFAARENLLFGFARPPGFRVHLWSFIASRPTAGAIEHAQETEDAAVAFADGYAALKRGDYEQAERLLAMAAARGSGRGAYYLGVVFRARGEIGRAEEAFKQADDGGMPEAAYNLGVLFRERGDLEQAEAALRRADSRGEPDGAHDLGLLLLGRGAALEAVAAFCRADARGHPEAPNSLGAFFMSLRSFQFARDAFERADARGSAKGSHNFGVALAASGNSEAAAAAFRRAKQRGFEAAVAAPKEGVGYWSERVAGRAAEDDPSRNDYSGPEEAPALQAMVRRLSGNFAQFSLSDVIEPLCIGVLGGFNVVIGVPTDAFEYATMLAEAATSMVAGAVTVTLTPAMARSRHAVGIAPREANFLVLKDITRFDRSVLTSMRPVLGESPDGQRSMMFQGREVPLPNLIAVIAVLDLEDERREHLSDLAPLFSIGVLAAP